MSKSRSRRGDPPTAPNNWREWRAEHLRNYLETDGEYGYIVSQAPTLLLTTLGRKSGKPYTTPLIFGRDGERYLVVASFGGAEHHPDWYANLVQNPEVEVQVRAERFKAQARTALAPERARLWQAMTAIWPAYDEYQTLTSREIPVVILDVI